MAGMSDPAPAPQHSVQPKQHPDVPLTGTAAYDAGAGELPSWSEIVDEHADGVYRLALRLTGNVHDAEDLTQETFMRVFRSLNSYRPGTFAGWLHRITTNLFLDMVRKRPSIRMEALPEDYETLLADPGAAGGAITDPEHAFALAHLDPALEAALNTLSPDFRVAVILCDGLGLSYDEIAETLGVKMGTVRSRIHRARAQLRQVLVRDETAGDVVFVGGR